MSDFGATLSSSACLYGGTTGSYYADSAVHPIPLGNTVYSDINLSNTFDGQNRWWKIYPLPTDEITTPYAAFINSTGDITATANEPDGTILCSAFDSTPPSGYSADFTTSPVNANNYTNVQFAILDGEAGATYIATASDGSNEIYKTTSTR